MSTAEVQNQKNSRVLEGNETFSQQSLEANSVLIKENSKVRQLIIIHNGEIAYFEPQRKNNLFILPVKNFICGFSYIFSNEEFPLRVYLTKPSVVSAFAVNQSKGIQNVILGKINIGLIALNSLQKETEYFFSLCKKYDDFYKIINNFIYNLSLCYYKFQPSIIDNLKEGENIIDKNLLSIKKIKEHFEENNHQLPKYITRNWLIQNNLVIDTEDNSFDFEETYFEVNLLKRLATLPIELQTQIFQKDLIILEQMSRKFNLLQSLIVKEIKKILYSIFDDLEIISKDEYSLIEKFSMIIDLIDSKDIEVQDNELLEVLEYINEKIGLINNQYQKILLSKIAPIQNNRKIIDKLSILKETLKKEEISNIETKKSVIKISDDKKGILEELKDSAEKILNFCAISKEDQQKFLKSLKDLYNAKNPLDSEPEIRRLKRPIHEIFWKAYTKAILKYRENRGNVPKYISLFLQFGYFDEKFLEPEQLIELYDLVDTTVSIKKDFSILDTTDWLNRIGDKKELPSINEVGEQYFEILKRENPTIKVKRIEEFPPDIDSNEKRIEYEVKNFITSNSKLVSGSPMSYFAILTKYHITAPKLKDLFLTKEKISTALNRLLEIDFSAFYREIVYNDEKAKIFKEFVMINVYPHLILMPSVGNKAMFWQELEEPRKKNTPARIALPILCTGDLFSMIIEAVGAFRWEIQRLILGPDYNNVGVPSLTSEYIDYIQFYHKNRDLTEEQKEKIKAEFKNFRDDRSKFVHDYSIWIKYESQGILKLNKIVRNIMYRYVPFAKGIRENLSKQPAYSEIHNRFKNIRTKKITELENRWRKYGEKSAWPPSLKATYEYYVS